MQKWGLMNGWFGLLLSLCLAACSSLNTTSDNNEAAMANVQLALAYLQQGQVAPAKQKLLLALQQAPHNPAPWYTMGYFLQSRGDFKRADYYYQRAVKLAPDDGAAQNNYGVFLCRTGHYRAAIKHFLLAAQSIHYLHPAGAYENAGFCALKIPDKKLALRYFHQALQQDPKRVVAQDELRKLQGSSAKQKPKARR